MIRTPLVSCLLGIYLIEGLRDSLSLLIAIVQNYQSRKFCSIAQHLA